MTEDTAAKTHGDRVDRAIERVKKGFADDIRLAREHPDEVLVRVLPAAAAFHLSAKYDMDLADHVLITQAGWHLGELLVKAYRQWKTRPARPSTEEVI